MAKSSRIASTSICIAIVSSAGAGSASAAIIEVSFTGITSSAEGAYLRQTDFLGGTTTYFSGPSYTDVVRGILLLDTSKLPALDPFEFEEGRYTFSTMPPASSFAWGSFSSDGYYPVATAGATSTLTYPIANPDYAGLLVVDRVDRSSLTSVPGAFGNSSLHSVTDTEVRTISISWADTLPLMVIDGVTLPDFSRITQASFGSYSQRNRYVVDQTVADDGTILAQRQLEWTLTHGQSAGLIDSISVRIFGVPEPSTWAMMIIGFATVGSALRRHRRRDSLASVRMV